MIPQFYVVCVLKVRVLPNGKIIFLIFGHVQQWKFVPDSISFSQSLLKMLPNRARTLKIAKGV